MKEAIAITEIIRRFRSLNKNKKLEVLQILKDILWEEKE